MRPSGISLDDRYDRDDGRVFLSGIQALVRLLVVQRRRDRADGLETAGFVSGYRGSPLGGLDKALWQAGARLASHDVHFQPGLNEDLAATAVWGSQQVGLFPRARHDGVFALWYGKGPGVDRSGDVFKHANAAGTAPSGGVLAVAGDDHGCKSSTLPHQSEQAFIAASIPVLHPAGVHEVVPFGLLGFALSRHAGLWVGFKILADVADSAGTVDLAGERLAIVRPPPAEVPGGLGIRWPDPPLEQEKRLEHRLAAAAAFARANRIDRLETAPERGRIGIAATGKAWVELLDALDAMDLRRADLERLGIRLLKVGMPWPLEAEGARLFAHGLDEVVIVEEKRGLIEDQLKQLLYHLPADGRPMVVGKTDERGRPLLPATGDLDATTIAAAVAGRLLRHDLPDGLRRRLEPVARMPRRPLVATESGRVPTFCAGCPHNGSTRVPEGSRAMAGIGCHYMAIWTQPRTATFTQMGGEGVPWIGQAPFTEEPHVFANLGDGTYQHSGILAVRAALAAGVTMTYKLLYNDAVAMTGGQAVDGGLPLDRLIAQLQAEGVRRIEVVAAEPGRHPGGRVGGLVVHARADEDALQRSLRETPGVTVLIHDQTCATELRRRRKRGAAPPPAERVVINELVCEGCGDCGEASNCLAVEPVETDFGRKRRIDQAGCSQDRSCLAGFCPSFVTLAGARPRRAGPAFDPDVAGLPEPARADADGGADVLIAGIGGTGIVTLTALLGMAAHLEERHAVTLDQTGLAQKYGAVTGHVRIGARSAGGAARIPRGRARLLIGADLITAAAEARGGRLARDARAVVDRHLRPTAAFTHDPDLRLDPQSLEREIRAAIPDGRVDGFDATEVATTLASPLAANVVLLGFACQRGVLPVGRAALEEAIRLNGTTVEENLAAFGLGRLAAADPAHIERLLAGRRPEPLSPPPTGNLETAVERRVRFLADYQDQAWADRYRTVVDRVRAAEERRVPGKTHLTDAVARSLFKLMAYKDEYEVARLFVGSGFLERLEREFEPGYRVQFHFAPTWLPRGSRAAEGRPRKWRVGGWILPLLRLLAAARRLRGTRLDPFLFSRERREERRLITEYETVVEELVRGLRQDNHGLAVAIARLPMRIRGYGHVKARNLRKIKDEEMRMLRSWRVPSSELMAAE